MAEQKFTEAAPLSSTNDSPTADLGLVCATPTVIFPININVSHNIYLLGIKLLAAKSSHFQNSQPLRKTLLVLCASLRCRKSVHSEVDLSSRSPTTSNSIKIQNLK
eukprot:TRINITY_DN7648_c0_g1_i1.p1 TRINITY_DN7648_c0_g1~~TRINITY_DN7648_c0_g1_i1.p1  ORF type:complete len:106 (-),score=5.35 TRINITY_DN7648_c0_g1_i1:228-545(-)